jgi:hypothetical protein
LEGNVEKVTAYATSLKASETSNGLPLHMNNTRHNARRLKRKRRTQNATSVEERAIGLENVHMKM